MTDPSAHPTFVERLQHDLTAPRVVPGSVVLFTLVTERFPGPGGDEAATRDFFADREEAAAVYERGEWHLTTPVRGMFGADGKATPRILKHDEFIELLRAPDFQFPRGEFARVVTNTRPLVAPKEA